VAALEASSIGEYYRRRCQSPAPKAIRATKDGRRFLYSPVVTRDEWLLSVSKGLLDRLFAGRVAPLAAHFSRHGKLSKRDIADLKRLIAEIDDGT
jgi:predicted transcriptional regulator